MLLVKRGKVGRISLGARKCISLFFPAATYRLLPRQWANPLDKDEFMERATTDAPPRPTDSGATHRFNAGQPA